jgi:hypothetical protein
MSPYRKSLLILFMLLWNATIVRAQQTVFQEQGAVTDDEPVVQFEVALDEGQTVVINVETTQGDLDPVLSLADHDGDVVAENDDRGRFDLNSRIIYTAEDDDTFKAAVSGYEESVGDFLITFRIGGDELIDNPYGEDAQVYDGEIEDEDDSVRFELEFTEGDTIVLETEMTSGELDTVMTLYSPGGIPLVRNDDRSRQTLNSAIIYTIRNSGTYGVTITGFGGSEGEFLLIVITDGDEEEVVDVRTEYFEGEVSDDEESTDYSFELDEGETVLLQTEAQDASLDTILSLFDPDGDLIEQNDDINTARGNYNSGIAYTAEESGQYTATVSSYGETTGEYILTVTIGGEELIDQLNAAKSARVELSGPELTRETEHFILHYTLEGDDATTEEYVDELADMMERIWEREIEELGWPAPPSDGDIGGDERYDVYLQSLLQDGIFGYCAPETVVGDNPNTEFEEENAATSFFVVENDMQEDTRGNSLGQLFTTAAHEFHHAIQFGFDINDEKWMYEATATWMETLAAGDDEDATPYVAGNFQSPEICFGDKSGTYVYGHWLFLQSIADVHGMDVVQELWQNAATLDGFDPLEETLNAHDEDIPTAMARYYIQNLLLVYDLASEIDATVNIELEIDDTGTWTHSSDGVQELAANYYEVDLREGIYRVTFAEDSSDGDLQLWAVGIDRDDADIFALGTDATFSNDGYDHFYLMVFNPIYDNNLDSCEFYTYELEVEDSDDEPLPVSYSWDASNFEQP